MALYCGAEEINGLRHWGFERQSRDLFYAVLDWFTGLRIDDGQRPIGTIGLRL